MSNLDRRSLLVVAGASAVASTALAIPVQGPITSPRIIRLRALYARLGRLPENHTDDDVNEICTEIHAIGDVVCQSPVHGPTDIVERALVAYYWLDRVSPWNLPPEDEVGADQLAFRKLIDGVLAYSPTA
jgi:hypothetical protein